MTLLLLHGVSLPPPWNSADTFAVKAARLQVCALDLHLGPMVQRYLTGPARLVRGLHAVAGWNEPPSA